MNQIKLVNGNLLDGNSPEDKGAHVPPAILRRGIGIFVIESTRQKEREQLLRRIRATEEMSDFFADQVYGRQSRDFTPGLNDDEFAAQVANEVPNMQRVADESQLSKFTNKEQVLAAELSYMDGYAALEPPAPQTPQASQDERDYWQSLAA